MKLNTKILKKLLNLKQPLTKQKLEELLGKKLDVKEFNEIKKHYSLQKNIGIFGTPKNVWFADFETTTKEHSKNHTHVAIYGIKGSNSFELMYGYSLNTFFTHNQWHKRNYIYFHNLSFDWSFIESWLIKNKFIFNQNETKLKQNEFYYLKDGTNKFYKAKVKFNNKTFVFYDSYKKIPLSLEKIGNILAIDNWDIKKLIIDYKWNNELYELKTIKEKDEYITRIRPKLFSYLSRDIDIIQNMFYALGSKYPQFYHHFTLTGIAKDFFKPYYFFEQDYINKINKQTWFFCKNAYYGGYTKINPKYKNKLLKGKFYYYDVNSLYPFIMKEYALPFGKPIGFPLDEFKQKDKYFCIIRIKIFRAIKKDHQMMSHLHSRKNFLNIEYLDKVDENHPIIISYAKEEWDEILKTYFVKYAILDSIYFYKKKNQFKNFINFFASIKKGAKQQKNDIFYTFAKLIQNSLYGKFGQKFIFINKILDKNYEQKTIEVIEDDKLYYIPLAVAITSFARIYLLKMIRKYKNYFVYCDTDSLILTKPLNSKYIDDQDYGKWKWEKAKFGNIIKFKCLGEKCYLMQNDKGKYHGAFAGLTKDEQKKLTFKKFAIGKIIKKGKKNTVQVNGGKLIIEDDYTIRTR